MKVTNFLVSPAICVPGETVNISFSVKAESGDEIYGLRIWMALPGIGESICYNDDSWTISVGNTKQVSVEAKMSSSALSAQLESSRSFSLENFGVQFGYFGSRVDVAFPFTFLDAWYSPGISIFALERAANSVPNDEGENLLADVLLGASAQAKKERMQARLYYRQGSAADTGADYIDLTGSLDALLAGVSDDAQLISQTFLKTYDWYFLLWFGDEFESAQAGMLVVRAFANMHLSGMETGGVCFGGFSSSLNGRPKLESYYPAYFYGGIEGVTNYSLREMSTGGMWINGKPIYRSVIEVGAKTSGTMYLDVSALGIETYVDLRGMFYASADYGDGYVYPAPYAAMSDSYMLGIEAASRTSIRINSSSRTWQSAFLILEYTKVNDVGKQFEVSDDGNGNVVMTAISQDDFAMSDDGNGNITISNLGGYAAEASSGNITFAKGET